MRVLIAALLLAMAGPAFAAEIVATDGATIRIDQKVYRLDGIDAPEVDQTCLDEHDEIWACGVTLRDQLGKHIGTHAVRCDDKGPDPIYKYRRLGICTVEGETITLNEWLVREGSAIKFGSDAKGPYAATETDARDNKRGLWKGCFADPRDMRKWDQNGAHLIGTGCQADHKNRTREKLFRVDSAMPPGCPIKAKLALRAIGYDGIYHLPTCGSYRRVVQAQRWFCSEEDARAAGFRKALTCR